MADFIVKFTQMDGQGVKEIPHWNIYMDGSSNKQARGAGVVLISPEEDRIKCMIRLEFSTTNNEAKYEAVLLGLDLAKVAGAEAAIIHYDSQVMVGYINGNYKAKGEQMKELSMVKSKMSEKFSVKFIQIPREENEQVDHLAKAEFVEYTDITS